MRKSTLQLWVLGILFAFLTIVQPLPSLGYDGFPVPVGIIDTINIILVVAALSVFEVGFLSVLFPNTIPPYFKKIIGMFMLFGFANILKHPGWFSVGYFNIVIVSQLPITIIDVAVMVTVGTTLFWAGGLMYDTATQLMVTTGNVCYRILKKLNLFELEDDEEGGKVVE